ncbi:uncharacterized protein C3orf38 homolog isoform X2 [Agrilus planipennis]|nr:uncharacterized protein C3orf38 homolog isoform X2 [Agrilus planipennis]
MDVAVTEILNKLEDEEIIGLAKTVTQGLLKSKTENRKDAIEAILKHSPNELSILRRKCITKDVLFEYVHQNDIQVSLPITKPELIDVIFTFWKKRASDKSTNSESNITPSIELCKSTSNVNNMAEQFSAWFYSMLNQSRPMGREHFWNDAKLTVNILNDAQCQNHNIDGDTLEI